VLVVLKYGSGEANTWQRGKADPLFSSSISGRTQSQCSCKWKSIHSAKLQPATTAKTSIIVNAFVSITNIISIINITLTITTIATATPIITLIIILSSSVHST
jgi:hypothetical protein